MIQSLEVSVLFFYSLIYIRLVFSIVLYMISRPLQSYISQNSPYNIRNSTVLSEGVRFTTCKTTVESGETVLVKYYTQIDYDEPFHLQREIQQLSLLEDLRFTPTLLASDIDYTANRGFIITSFEDGKTLNPNVLSETTLLESVATALREIHTTPIPKQHLFGKYGAEGHGLVFDSQRALEKPSYSEEYTDILENTMKVLSQETTPIKGITHGDIIPSNVLYDTETNTVATILDWEFSGYSDIQIDIAKTEIRNIHIYADHYNKQSSSYSVKRAITKFRSAYGQELSNQRIHAYKQLFCLRELGLSEKFRTTSSRIETKPQKWRTILQDLENY